MKLFKNKKNENNVSSKANIQSLEKSQLEKVIGGATTILTNTQPSSPAKWNGPSLNA